MFFKLYAPQALKSAAAAVHGIRPGKIGGFTAQIAEFQIVGGHTGIWCHDSTYRNFYNSIKILTII
jgi:hypothetical protein